VQLAIAADMKLLVMILLLGSVVVGGLGKGGGYNMRANMERNVSLINRFWLSFPCDEG